MRTYILGIDGYIGWALAQYLSANGHVVGGCDSGLKRAILAETGEDTLIPVDSMDKRFERFSRVRKLDLALCGLDRFVGVLKEFQPDVLINLAQVPSAPFSMMDYGKCILTQDNNNRTNLIALWAAREFDCLPIVQLGTMGEYGTPNTDIPEGDFELEFRGRKATLQFPRRPGSLYHASKVASSVNCEFATRARGLSITDIMQGVVYGVTAPGVESPTVLLPGEWSGTCINRFVAQAIVGYPLTVYGTGLQTRGYLPLRDSLHCIELLCENPPELGEYRVVNQFDQSYSILGLEEIVRRCAIEAGLPDPGFEHYRNPRVEDEKHYYNPDRNKLLALGYAPEGKIEDEVRSMIKSLLPHSDRAQELSCTFAPKTSW